jgi:hypothetical protein
MNEQKISEGDYISYGDIKGIVVYQSDNLLVILQSDGAEFVLYNDDVVQKRYGDNFNLTKIIDVVPIAPLNFVHSEKEAKDVEKIKQILNKRNKQ